MRRRWLWVTAVAVITLGVVLAVVTARLFVWPVDRDVRRVNAVVVLSGDTGDRMKAALALMERGAAPVLVHAGTPDSDFARNLCRAGNTAFEVVCLLPAHDSTQTEARAVARLARARRWSSMAVVTSTFHVTRAGIEFRRCFDGRVTMVPTGAQLGRRHRLVQVPGELLRVAYLQVVRRGC